MLTRLCDWLYRLLHLPQTARQLANLGLVLWVVSLCLPGFRSDSGTWFGYSILLSGWLVPSPWYANPFLLYALLRLRNTDILPRRSATLAFLVACTIIFFSSHPSPHFSLGGTHHVRGFGLGAAFWLASILVLQIAVGVRSIERSEPPPDPDMKTSTAMLSGSERRNVGVLLLAAITFCGPAWAAWNFYWADPDEYPYLLSAPFKRGAVWHVGLPMPEGMIPFDGPLEVHGSSKYPFTDHRVDDLLAWGIPVVRMNGLDYSLTYPAGQRVVSAVPARGEAGAILLLDQKSPRLLVEGKYTRFDPGRRINKFSAQLMTADRSRQVIDHEWVVDAWWRSAADWPGGYAPLRNAVMHALDLKPSAAELAKMARPTGVKHRALLQDVRAKAVAEEIPLPEDMNRCPVSIHPKSYEFWNDYPEWRGMGHPVQVGEGYFFGLMDWGHHEAVFCQDGAVYVVQEKHRTVIEKRALDDFRLFWAVELSGWPSGHHLLSLQESMGGVFMHFKDAGNSLVVRQFPLPASQPGTDYPIRFEPPVMPLMFGAEEAHDEAVVPVQEELAEKLPGALPKAVGGALAPADRAVAQRGAA